MSEFQICCCGTQPGYPHRIDCPRPLYNATDSQFEQWEREWLANPKTIKLQASAPKLLEALLAIKDLLKYDQAFAPDIAKICDSAIRIATE